MWRRLLAAVALALGALLGVALPAGSASAATLAAEPSKVTECHSQSKAAYWPESGAGWTCTGIASTLEGKQAYSPADCHLLMLWGYGGDAPYPNNGSGVGTGTLPLCAPASWGLTADNSLAADLYEPNGDFEAWSSTSPSTGPGDPTASPTPTPSPSESVPVPSPAPTDTATPAPSPTVTTPAAPGSTGSTGDVSALTGLAETWLPALGVAAALLAFTGGFLTFGAMR
jgi:hypothetical protein